jgi:UDP-N-acetylmuramoyl-tripeptide--D-alanyl-D-alanine ligase
MVNAKIVNTTPFINIKYKNKLIESKLIGSYQFENIMLSICIGDFFNISLQNIKYAIEEYTPSNNRSQIVNTKNNTLVLDAYNANPSSMSAMLCSFAEQKYENKICILGDMLELGDYAKDEHTKIVNLCKKLSLECYFIGIEFNRVTKNSFISTDDFEKYLNNKPLVKKTILLKGSRGIELERLVPFF